MIGPIEQVSQTVLIYKMSSVNELPFFLEILFDDFLENSLLGKTAMIQRVSTLVILHREDRQKVENYVEEVVQNYLPDDFNTFFRVSRETFQILYSNILDADELRRRNPAAGREQVSIEKDLLMTLWYLGNQETMKSVADRFNVSVSTFVSHYRRMLNVVSNILLRKLISWPTEGEKANVIDSFQRKGGFPGVLGAIDGCHIKISKPPERPNDYFNRKGFYSVILQAVCRDDRRFTDIYCGWPGKVHDARVFRNSPLAQRLPDACGMNHILGDGAYPLTGNVLTPYRDNGNLTQAQKRYNTSLSATRVAIENSFGMLKNRFRRLKCIELSEIEYIVKTIVCACILHNFCLINKDVLQDEPIVDDDNDDGCGNHNVNINDTAEGIRKRQMITRRMFP